jgi:hypothetical protein
MLEGVTMKRDIQVHLKPNGMLNITPIEPDDDGLDPNWITLPHKIRWEQVRKFMEQGTSFERRFAKREVSLRVDKTKNVFEGLPKSQAAYNASRQLLDGN